MSALLRAELLRLFSRRLLLLLLVAMALVAAFTAAVNAEFIKPLTAQERNEAHTAWKLDQQNWEQECSGNPTSMECDGWEVPASVDDYIRVPQSFSDFAMGSLDNASPLGLLAVAILAAALVGVEFSSGNIGTQLLFTPRRIPLMLAKVAAASVGGLLLALTFIATSLALTALMFLSLRGAEDMTAGIELPLLMGRLLLLSLLIAIMASALAMGVGSTMITAGVFAVVLIGSMTIAGTIPGKSIVQLFLPSNVLLAMLTGRFELYDYTSSNYEDWGIVRVLTYDWALAYSVIGTALIVAVAAWVFRRRDILR